MPPRFPEVTARRARSKAWCRLSTRGRGGGAIEAGPTLAAVVVTCATFTVCPLAAREGTVIMAEAATAHVMTTALAASSSRRLGIGFSQLSTAQARVTQMIGLEPVACDIPALREDP